MGQGLVQALACPGSGGSSSQNCPEGQGALTPCVSWGWRGLKKNVAHHSLRILSGTALMVAGTLPRCNDHVPIYDDRIRMHI